MHTASFHVAADPTEAGILLDALRVESEEGPEGTRLELDVTDAGITIAIEADDLSGLRAAVHGALRLLDAARRTAALS